ncbi:MAG: hypothetical protein K2W85_11770 [Phycisphaerales bacterium]|nr:hypothetical protein [Phycisphaerales bacterium]
MPVTYSDIPGITIWAGAEVFGDGREPRVLVGDLGVFAAECRPDVDRVWGELRASNPRLFDGPVLLVDLDSLLEKRELRACRGTYKTLATAAGLGREDVRALGVQGLVMARERSGDACLLLGKRGGDVRIYPGLWENAPSGTVEPTRGSTIGVPELLAALAEEGDEEVGIDLHAGSARCVALVDDAIARTVDVVVQVELDAEVTSRVIACQDQECGIGEYTMAAWSPMGEVVGWVEREAGVVSPSTRALVRWMVANALD